ncbi:MAG: NAD(P)H-dependent oxidoreductase [Pseudomonadota bacterium]
MIKKIFAAKKNPESNDASQPRYNDLRAIFLNCTLKKSPDASHTDCLMDVSRSIMEANGVKVESFRFVDHDIAAGVYPDMTAHGWNKDDWPAIWKRLKDADILVVGTPIWLGQHSSECTKLIERLYAHSSQTNDKGQYIFYGKAGGCLVTGNEDGIKHVAMSVLYSLQHVGFTVPPQADAGWIGEAGPGPSYGDKKDDGTRVGFDNEFTQRNTTFMTWNLIHYARMLKDAGGVPAHGNIKNDWKGAFAPNDPNPEYR